MLQGMNKFAKSWVASIFLGIVALSFVVWGIGDYTTFTGASNVVAKVGNTEISGEAFQGEYQRLQQELRQRGEVTPEMARLMGLPQIALKTLIARASMDNVIDSLGLEQTRAQAEASIYDNPAFRNASGSFDRAVFLNALQNAGFSEREYVEAVRRGVMRQQLSLAVQTGFKLPMGYMRVLYDYLEQTRAADFVVVSPDSVGAIAPPSDAVLAEYLKKNIDRFSTPEYRSITYAGITPADLKDQIAISEEQVNQAYEANKAQFSTPERRDIEQISYPDEAAARAARAKIAAGQSFADAAAERGLKPSDISLGSLVVADLSGERGKAAFALAQNGVSEPVKDTFGWMLLHVARITPGTSRDEAEVKAELRTALLEQSATAKIDEILNTYQDAVAAGDDIPAAAKKAGMKSGRIASMDAKGLAADGSATGSPLDTEFLSQAFNSEVGDQGDPFKTQNGSAYVIKVEGVVPPKPRPLEQVRAEVISAWTAEERAARLKTRVDQLVAKAKADKSLAGVAGELRAPIQKTPGLKQATTDQTNLSAQLVGQLFQLPVGGIAFAPRPNGEGFVIARVSGIANPPAIVTPEFTSTYQQASNQVASEFEGLLASAGQSGAPVTANQNQIDTLIGEGQ